MLSKTTMTEVAIELSDARFKEHYELLEEKIGDCLLAAFEGERISQERLHRIAVKFCINMRKVK